MLTVFWNTILERFFKNSTILQVRGCTLSTCVAIYSSLHHWVASDLRDHLDQFEIQARKILGLRDDGTTVCKQRTTAAVDATPRDMFRRTTYIPILDSLAAGLSRRKATFDVLHGRFGILSDFHELDATAIRQKAHTLPKLSLRWTFRRHCRRVRSVRAIRT